MDIREIVGTVASTVNSTSARRVAELVAHPVPGDGPETFHSFNPLEPSERPAGRPTPSDLPAPPATKHRRDRSVRRLRTLSLPATGVAAGLAAMFFLATVSAADVPEPGLVEVWSTTMTVAVDGSSSRDLPVDFTHRGYDREREARPLGRIGEGTFGLNGVDYAISRLAYWTRSGSVMSPYHQQLNIHTGNELPSGSVFELDDARFPVSRDSRYFGATAGLHAWDYPGLDWSDGDEVTVRLLVPVISAQVVEAPRFHDGSSPFRVRVRFSRELLNNASEVQQAFAAKTAGGKVFEARRVGVVGRAAEDWDIHVQPGGGGNVTIALHTGGPCHLPARLCSRDTLRVGEWLHEVRGGAWVQAWTGATIPLLTQGLTATVVEAPDRHDGASPFDVRVRFDAELFNSYLKLMRAFEETTGGTVVKARPAVRQDGTQDGTLWNITVRPDGSGDVTLTLKTGGPCRNIAQPCSRNWKWVTEARDFPLTILSGGGGAPGVRRSARYPLPWALQALSR